jgi:Raf kinase inhibitor-like YbhB/YbcL family protein
VIRRTIVLIVLFALVAAACSDDGTTLTEPGTDGATPRTTPEEAAFADAEGIFALRSLDFESNGEIPAEFTRRDGDDIHPELRWVRTPDEAKELALVVRDETADEFLHWVVTGLSPVDTQLPAGVVPPGATQWSNDFGISGWSGPDPPGDVVHSYVFSLHALDDLLSLGPDTPTDEVILAIEERTFERTLLVGTYQ